MDFDVALESWTSAVVHGQGCGHRVRERNAGFALSVLLEPETAWTVPVAQAYYRDWVTFDIHQRVDGTPHRDCDVQFLPCSGLVDSAPPAVLADLFEPAPPRRSWWRRAFRRR